MLGGEQPQRSVTPGVIQGETQTLTVPFVAEPWSATAGRPAPEMEIHRPKPIGMLPGFRATKKAINALRRQRLRQSSPATAVPNLQSSGATIVFQGPSENDTNQYPPDSQVAAGPNYVVVVINSVLEVYDKSGNSVTGAQPLISFFSSLGLAGEVYDSRLIYDVADARFILTAAEVDLYGFRQGNVLVAVSQNSDPTGTWYKYELDFMGRNLTNTANTFPDFPTLGLSNTALYISTGQFELNSTCVSTDAGLCAFSDTWITTIQLSDLLAGNSTLTQTTFKNVTTAGGAQAFAIEPAVTYGAAPAEFLVAADFTSSPTSELNVFSINTTGTPTLTSQSVTAPSYQSPPDAAQPGTTTLIATNDFRILNAVWANNTLWCAQNVADSQGANAVSRWYALSTTNPSSVSVSQSGEVNGAGDAYFPAISVNNNGDAEMSFTTSSATQYASAAFSGRSASDAAGTMRTFVPFAAGAAKYVEAGAPRWGDYSGAMLDPDGLTIWLIAEYSKGPNPNYGTAVAAIVSPAPLAVSATTVNFGNQTVNIPSQPQSLTLTNSSGAALTLGQVTVSGLDPGDFSFASDQCSSSTLQPAGACTVGLIFDPSTTGSLSASLLLTLAGGGVEPIISLVGTGVPPTGSVAVTPASLTFPDTPVRTLSAPVPLKLTNTSASPLQGFSISVTTPFAESNDCGTLIPASASCTVNVRFAPIVPGVNQGTLQFVFPYGLQTSQGSVNVPLQGNGAALPIATLCPLAVSYGNQSIGTPASQNVIISNTGSSPLQVTQIAVNGSYTYASNCGSLPFSLAARTQCTLQVTFNPAAGSQTGTLTFTDNAAGSPQTVTLSGSGVTAAGAVAKRKEALVLPLTGPALLTNPATAGKPFKENNPAKASTLSAAEQARARRLLATIPLAFEPNLGQFRGPDATPIRFLARAQGLTVLLARRDAFIIPAPAHAMRATMHTERARAARPALAEQPRC